MSDRITEQERQAISSYVTGGGVVHRCPPGTAIGAGNADVHTFGEYLAELGLVVVPIRQREMNRETAKLGFSRDINWRARFSKAA